VSLAAVAELERDRYLDALRYRGFTVHSADNVTGVLDVPEVDPAPIPVRIALGPGFPYSPPKVCPLGDHGGWSWHRDQDGCLCLYGGVEQDMSWTDVDQLLDRVRTWFRRDKAGWTDDDPDLDLETYLPRADLQPHVVIYGDLDVVAAEPHQAQLDRIRWRVVPGRAPTKGGARRRERMGVEVVHVGEPAAPFHDWQSLSQLLPESGKIADRLRTGRTGLLIVRYRRRGHEAAVVVCPTSREPLEIGVVTSASDAPTIRQMRAGPDREHLADATVAVVGVGAIGSHVALELARAGVGSLTLVDPDTLVPGNCIRHVLDLRWAGVGKAQAMGVELEGRFPGLKAVDLTSWVQGASDMEQLLAEHDVVIEATGSLPMSRLVGEAAASAARPAVSVCLQREGQVVRVDRHPLAPGEAHEPELAPRPPAGPVLREGGCGDPVSPAPPWACAIAAGLATAVVTDLLTGRGEYPPTLLEALRPQPEAGLDSISSRR
jgi:molybdopterin/thiamine biosynthesis adenylyltransferase